MTFASRLAALALAAMVGWIVPASAQQAPPPNLPPPQRSPTPNTYGPDELVTAGHRFFAIVAQRLYLFSRETNRDAFAADPERFLYEVGKRWPALLDQLGQ